MSIRSFLKGWVGEAMVAAAHRIFLDTESYFSINNVTLQTRGGTTQIDHVVVSIFGIFVIEAKNIDGWIFGDEKSAKWTVVKPGRKHQIQNPLRQNFRHTKAITEFLNVEDAKIHSLVMFWGECEFKTPMPSNVLCEGYSSYIKSFGAVVFTDSEVHDIVAALKAGVLPKTWATRRAHLASLEARYSSKSICPKCTEPLVLRTAKSGARAGSRFYGCSAYPRCKFTAAYESDA
jgi:restriction system protein